MMRTLIIPAIAALLSIAAGCASTREASPKIDAGQPLRTSGGNFGSFKKVPAEPDQKNIAAMIRTKFNAWKGTRYRMGGRGRGGFDCSGFSQHIFATVFGIKLPRTTAQQARVGRRISRQQLKPGDLVFFKPPTYPRHVGVYVGNGEFVHASSSKGVMLSRMNSDYWRKSYWTSRRVLSAGQDT